MQRARIGEAAPPIRVSTHLFHNDEAVDTAVEAMWRLARDMR
ncbi:hypothetical protein ACFYVL_00620 [Streptomyces sp. NPDC004111]